MAEIRYNSVYDAVTLALHAAFPPPIKIHGGEVQQGLTPGDFTVVMPALSQVPQLGARYRRGVTVDVIYYPRRGDVESYDIADRLAQVLEIITTPAGDQLRGRDLHFERVDGMLHALVEYPHYVYKERQETPMEDLTLYQEGGSHEREKQR